MAQASMALDSMIEVMCVCVGGGGGGRLTDSMQWMHSVQKALSCRSSTGVSQKSLMEPKMS